MPNVLITDGHWHKTLPAVRSLGKAGLEVHVGETTYLATSLFSKYCHKALKYPSPIFHPGRFIEWLVHTLKETRYETILPMEEDTLLAIVRARDQIDPYTKLLLPDLDQIEMGRDKGKFYKLAEEQNWPIPRTFDAEHIPEPLNFPIIVKPKTGTGSKGVQTFETRDAVIEYLKTFSGDASQLVFQQKVEGIGYGLTALFDENSQVKASYVHKRLREYPVTGGASTLRVSIKNEKVREIGLTVLKALRWKGPAMVEFKVNEATGDVFIIELNPRYPGSLALGIAAGVDFPLLHYRLAIGEDFPEQRDYRENVLCRWLLPGDILNFLKNPNRFHLKPSFFDFFNKECHDDILSVEDPMPTLGVLLSPIALLFDKDLRLKASKKMPSKIES